MKVAILNPSFGENFVRVARWSAKSRGRVQRHPDYLLIAAQVLLNAGHDVIFVEAAAFRKIGGFNHEFFAAEELDLSQRLKKLARATGKTTVILHRHPVKTSARKVQLYTPREMTGVFLHSIFNHRRTVRSREKAFLWYDGRR